MIWSILIFIGGGMAGLLLAALMGAAAKGQQEHDLVKTWHDGYEAGKRVSRGKELLGMVRGAVREE